MTEIQIKIIEEERGERTGECNHKEAVYLNLPLRKFRRHPLIQRSFTIKTLISFYL